MVASTGPRSLGVFSLTLFPFPSPLFFLCTVDSFTLSSADVTNLYISGSVLFNFRALILSSLPTHSVAIFVPGTFTTIVPCPLVLPSCMMFLDLASSFQLALNATISCFSMYILLLRCPLTALGPSSQLHPMARPHAFCNHLVHRGVQPICVHIFPGRFACLCLTVDPCLDVFAFLIRNRHNIVLVSHLLILSRVSTVHDQVSLQKAKTA